MYLLSLVTLDEGGHLVHLMGVYQDDLFRDVSNLIAPSGLSFWVLAKKGVDPDM